MSVCGRRTRPSYIKRCIRIYTKVDGGRRRRRRRGGVVVGCWANEREAGTETDREKRERKIIN